MVVDREHEEQQRDLVEVVSQVVSRFADRSQSFGIGGAIPAGCRKTDPPGLEFFLLDIAASRYNSPNVRLSVGRRRGGNASVGYCRHWVRGLPRQVCGLACPAESGLAASVSVAMKKYPLVVKSGYPFLAR
ncbi:hypothetical protein L842_4189 [Mycobacterium intracellulare MIN_052511_1280]|nr:hypothetical protein L842_4189 [Mycobacterium intracellulare MIN_052511_1280]